MTDPVQLLQELIRFDATNLPAKRGAAVAHNEGPLGVARTESARHRRQSCRPNLVARLRGEGGHLMPLVHGADKRVRAEAVSRAVESYPP
ncbi:MAG: hypothetical protein ABR569_06955 [Gaiellaceae bacterium]